MVTPLLSSASNNPKFASMTSPVKVHVPPEVCKKSSLKMSVFLFGYLLFMILVSESLGHGAMSCFGVCRRSDVLACRRCRHREPLRFGKRGDQPPIDLDYVINDKIPASRRGVLMAPTAWASVTPSKMIRRPSILHSFSLPIHSVSEEDVNSSFEAR